MFQEKEYKVICHGCGTVHTVVASFLSSPVSLEVSGVAYPTMGCGSCRAQKGRIREAFDALMSTGTAWDDFKARNWAASAR